MTSAAIAIDSRRWRVSAQEFQQMLQHTAYLMWQEKEPSRRLRDWLDAANRLWEDFRCGRRKTSVCWTDIQPLAHQLWLERKETDALQDWHEAEERVARGYEVAA